MRRKCKVQGWDRETSGEEADSARTLNGWARWHEREARISMQRVVDGAHRRGHLL